MSSRFSTYAAFWVRSFVAREAGKALIRIPESARGRDDLAHVARSLDEPVAGRDDLRWGELLEDDRDVEGEAVDRVTVAALLSTLPAKEAAVLRARAEEQTLAAIGQQQHMSKQGVQHLEKRALRKLKLLLGADAF